MEKHFCISSSKTYRPKLPPSVSIQEMAMRKVTRTQFDEDDEDMVRNE